MRMSRDGDSRVKFSEHCETTRDLVLMQHAQLDAWIGPGEPSFVRGLRYVGKHVAIQRQSPGFASPGIRCRRSRFALPSLALSRGLAAPARPAQGHGTTIR